MSWSAPGNVSDGKASVTFLGALFGQIEDTLCTSYRLRFRMDGDYFKREVLDVLASRTLKPVSVTNPEKPDDPEAPQPVRALLIGNKTDIAAPGDLEGLEEMYGDGIRLLGVSAETGEGLDALRKAVFDLLGVMRVYCKQPGKEADVAEPFVLPIGGTVADFAELVHRDFPDRLKFARLWGRDKFQGIQVHGDYVLGDRDVLELHVR